MKSLSIHLDEDNWSKAIVNEEETNIEAMFLKL